MIREYIIQQKNFYYNITKKKLVTIVHILKRYQHNSTEPNNTGTNFRLIHRPSIVRVISNLVPRRGKATNGSLLILIRFIITYIFVAVLHLFGHMIDDA